MKSVLTVATAAAVHCGCARTAGDHAVGGLPEGHGDTVFGMRGVPPGHLTAAEGPRRGTPRFTLPLTIEATR